jgi:hypothetical protein
MLQNAMGLHGLLPDCFTFFRLPKMHFDPVPFTFPLRRHFEMRTYINYASSWSSGCSSDSICALWSSWFGLVRFWKSLEWERIYKVQQSRLNTFNSVFLRFVRRETQLPRQGQRVLIISRKEETTCKSTLYHESNGQFCFRWSNPRTCGISVM